MIFPIDINKRITNKRKLGAGENLVQLIVVIIIVGNFFGFMLINWLIDSFFGGGLLKTFIVLLILDITAVITVFRFFIFDENAKLQESKAGNNDSFARYMHVRKDLDSTVNVNNAEITVIEFDNGSASVTFEMKFGSNDDTKVAGTNALMQKLFKIGALYNLELRACIMSEDFENSDEFIAYKKRINATKQQALKDAMTEFASKAISVSTMSSNVDIVYFTIRTQTNYQRAELDTILRKVLSTISESYTAFRSIRTLSIQGAIYFYQKFYGIAAIDLSMLKIVELADDVKDSYAHLVSVYRLESADGRVFQTSADENSFNTGEKQL